MVMDVAKVRKGREAERAEVAKSGAEASRVLEMQYIADALECIRVEIVGISTVLGMIARKP